MTTFSDLAINDLKVKWFENRGYSGSLSDMVLKYYNDLCGGSFLSSGDALERTLLNAGYTGSKHDMYYRMLLESINGSASDYSLTDAERKFYSDTNNQFGILTKTLADYTGLTFYKSHRYASSVNANYSIGSGTGTFTASRGASNPATYVDAFGVVWLVTTSNTPRFTQGFYDTTGFVSRPGLMMERASTNLLQDSYFADGSTTYWEVITGGTVAADTTYSNPYGAGQIEKIVGTAINQGMVTSTAKKVADVQGTKYTVSALVRGTGSVKLYWSDAITQVSGEFILDPNEWTRVQFTFLAAATTTSLVGVINFANAALTCYVANIQCEANPYATSFIPTTTAALTRNQEKLTYLTSGNRTAATESVFIKFTVESAFTSDANYRLLTDTVNVGRYFSRETGTSVIKVFPNITNNGAVFINTTTSPAAGTSYVLGATMNSAGTPGLTVYIDGVSEGTTDAGFTAPAWGTYFSCGHYATGDHNLDGIIQSVAFFSDAKSAGDVLAISNILAAG